MSINFEDLLTIEQKQAILTQKIQQLAIEGYQLQINKSVIESTENNEQALHVVNENMEVISTAIATYQEELNKLI